MTIGATQNNMHHTPTTTKNLETGTPCGSRTVDVVPPEARRIITKVHDDQFIIKKWSLLLGVCMHSPATILPDMYVAIEISCEDTCDTPHTIQTHQGGILNRDSIARLKHAMVP